MINILNFHSQQMQFNKNRENNIEKNQFRQA